MESKNATVLIIDDDARNTFALSLVLRSKGYTCAVASDTRSGMQSLRVNDGIQIVLLDMMMPDMDGYESIGEIRKLPGRENIPIVAVTAQAMPGDKEKCLAAGADAYVSKPVNVDILIEILKQYL